VALFEKRKIILGVSGSIAACRSVDIARRLADEGADVSVVMTGAARRFITPYLLEAVTGNPVHTDIFGDPFVHINLPKSSQLFIIAPATANTINKLSAGIADNLLCNMWLAYEGPVIIAPAMNYRMYRSGIVRKNIGELRKSGVRFVGPVTGSLACGEEGEGRMADVADIVEAAVSALTPKDLAGHNIIVTAGPTIEPIDPARFISNRSSGKMGYAVALAAKRRGADVTLISGPTCLKAPEGVAFVRVERASEMEAAVLHHFHSATCVIMAAAVSDFSPSSIARVKLRKRDVMSLNLKKNTDILKKIGGRKGGRILIGFAAESGMDVRSAGEKLKEKNLDMIVLNDISRKDAGFDADTNIVTLIDRKGEVAEYPMMKKIEVAGIILDRMLRYHAAGGR